MRISDWSSDVCSSDLGGNQSGLIGKCVDKSADGAAVEERATVFKQRGRHLARRVLLHDRLVTLDGTGRGGKLFDAVGHALFMISEERRVGKECLRKCRYRWSRSL